MFVLAVTAGGVRRKNVAGAQARQARGPDHIPIELWGVLIVSPPVVVFADEIRMVELPSHFFRQRSGGGVSVGGADGTLGRRQGVPPDGPRPGFLVHADKHRFLPSEIENGLGLIDQCGVKRNPNAAEIPI